MADDMQVSGPVQAEVLDQGAGFVGKPFDSEVRPETLDRGPACAALVIGDAPEISLEQVDGRFPVSEDMAQPLTKMIAGLSFSEGSSSAVSW
jgi:hypothetical protein